MKKEGMRCILHGMRDSKVAKELDNHESRSGGSASDWNNQALE